ncbi:NUDIX hydrolase [Actinoplanes rectilineatus]|uniref:NUDIX hydrolase n=1 Tax=Actinoplanes rectilineatus TaxID=113571 RepID=UPI000A4A4E24|nr:NUDIX hydrolase [Actinoplanes rectilineatus]
MTDGGLSWQQVGARPAPAGFLKVRARTYRYPNGAEADWDIIQGGNTAAVVALTDDDQVVLVRQFRPGPGKVLLELPGGNADGDEPVLDGAVRELLEETGFAAQTAEVVASTYLASYSTHVRHAVLARGCRRVADPQPGQDEFVEVVTLPVPEFVRHVLGGQLTDMDMAPAGLVAAGILKH